MIYSVLLSIVVVVTVLLMVTNVSGYPQIGQILDDCQMEANMILAGSGGSYGSKYSLNVVCCFVSAHVKYKSQTYYHNFCCIKFTVKKI